MKDIIRGTIRGVFLISGLGMAVVLAGCSRASVNYQIAESIGTLGLYENNEPVETPKMKAARELMEQQLAEEEAFQSQLDMAKAYADSYDYETALDMLQAIEGTENTQDRLDQVIDEYQFMKSSLVNYTGNIPHLCFPTLIADTKMAFDGDAMASTYASTMITVQEFKNILDCLYINDYVLVNLTDIVYETRDDRGVRMMERQAIMLPPEKKPVIISQDNVNYSGVSKGDGIANRLTVDSNGKVKAVYTDPKGHDLTGDYDLVPVLDAFIEEHPDFAYQGARGIVSVSGAEGMFGYDTRESVFTAESGKREEAGKVADALISSGWTIACAGYNHNDMFSNLTVDQIDTSLEKWATEIGSLTGETSVLFYPYGGEVTYPSEHLNSLIDNGYQYLCGLWSEDDLLDIKDEYIRQTRRFVDGYSLMNAASNFSQFFAIQMVLDENR